MLIKITTNLAKRSMQTMKICNSFARFKNNQPDLFQAENTLSKKLNLTFSALLEIERRKPEQHQIQQFFEDNLWQIKQAGKLIELTRDVFGKQVHVVFLSHKYPVQQSIQSPKKSNQYYKKQSMYEYAVELQPQQRISPKTYLDFKVYIRRQNSPNYLIISCSMSLNGIYPYSVDFTKDKDSHILGKQTQIWNPYQDLSLSLTDYMRSYLSILGIDEKFGIQIIKYNCTALQKEYVGWVQEMRDFMCK